MVTRRQLLQGASALALLGGVGLRGAPAAGAAAAKPAAKKNTYVPVTDPLVRKKLSQWQDWKFGIILHWGTYSQLGIVESWSICSEDEPWCKRPKGVGYVEWKRRYEQLPKTFNPVKFDPDGWARAAHDAGMRYVVFTTKHHDGFCMFDTATTDYRITAPDVPFHTNPRANAAKAVFDAFRARDFGIGAYFSKADWHTPDYWSPEWATPTRNNNYDTRKYPETWKRFVEFTHKQVEEITSQYGRIDLMWLDAGWVDGAETHPDAEAYGMQVPWAQDIDMPRIAELARRNQPGIILVNRDEGGPYENYRTPEQMVPKHPLPYPWETCMTMGTSWSWKPDDEYKSPRELVHTLVGIVAKGGNLLLGIGPEGNGTLPAAALQRLQAIGEWMKVNGSAIHGTRPIAPYEDGKFRFTRNKDGSVNAIYLAAAGEAPPASVVLRGVQPTHDARIELLGGPESLAWTRHDSLTTITLPPSVRRQLSGALAWTLRISAVQLPAQGYESCDAGISYAVIPGGAPASWRGNPESIFCSSLKSEMDSRFRPQRTQAARE
ncbi:MAG: alpha-L-fucosidase [Rhodanobacteraceae bacterium]|nr:MAG: alpha-L-fucosidase [Rhodanobacteraceae bacterium]